MKKLFATALLPLCALGLSLSACDSKAEDRLEDAAEKVEDTAEDAADKIKDKVDK